MHLLALLPLLATPALSLWHPHRPQHRRHAELEERLLPITATTTVLVEMTETRTVWVMPTDQVAWGGDGGSSSVATGSVTVSESASGSSATASASDGSSSSNSEGPSATLSSTTSFEAQSTSLSAEEFSSASASVDTTASSTLSVDPSASASITSSAEQSSFTASSSSIASSDAVSSTADISSSSSTTDVASSSATDVSSSSTAALSSSSTTDFSSSSPSSTLSGSDSFITAPASQTSLSSSPSASLSAEQESSSSSSAVESLTAASTDSVTDSAASASLSVTASSSSSTASASKSVKQSATKSISRSATASVSHSSSESVTHKASVPHSASESVSSSATDSITQSVTSSATESVTASVTRSITASVTQSVTESVTQSATESVTKSATESATQSSTDSVTPSASASVTESITAASVTTSSTTASASSTLSAIGSTIMAGYYPDWSGDYLSPENVDWSKFDVMDFAFALPTSDGNLEFTQDDSSDLLTRLVSTGHAAGKRVKLSIGGWTGSAYFSTICASKSLRKTFVSNILTAYNSYNLDGIDIDWEYPGTGGASGNAVSSSDSAHFLTFLKDLRAALPSGALITTATQVWPFADSDGNPMTDVSGFAAVIDWILIMNYDIWGSSSTPGPNAPLSDACGNSTQPLANAYAAVSSWTSAGMPANQITLGVPAYGYLQKSSADHLIQRRGLHPASRNPSNRTDARRRSSDITLYNTDGGTTDGQVMFEDLIQQGVLVSDSSTGSYIGAGGFVREWDSCSSTPWLKSKHSDQIVTYDDPQSMSLKGQFAAQAGLRGCNVFSVDGDYINGAWPLTDAVRSGLGL